MKKTSLVLLVGLLSGLAVSRGSAEDEAVVEVTAVAEHCDLIGILPVLPEDEIAVDDSGIAESGEGGEGGEAEVEVTAEEPVSGDGGEPVEVKEDGETVCPEIYYMNAGGPLPWQRGESAGEAAVAERDEAEEAPAPKFTKKSISEVVKQSSKPAAVVKKGRVFLRR